MRSATLRNRKKKCVRGPSKRRRRRTSNEIVWDGKNEVSLMSLDNMNDVIRVVKTQRVKGKRWWKVMPKDSCEVYKSRKRRYTYNDRRKQDEVDTDESAKREEGERKNNGKSRNKQQSGSDKEVRFRKTKKRSSEYSSASSTTMSTMSTVSSSSTEMDYE